MATKSQSCVTRSRDICALSLPSPGAVTPMMPTIITITEMTISWLIAPMFWTPRAFNSVDAQAKAIAMGPRQTEGSRSNSSAV